MANATEVSRLTDEERQGFRRFTHIVLKDATVTLCGIPYPKNRKRVTRAARDVCVVCRELYKDRAGKYPHT